MFSELFQALTKPSHAKIYAKFCQEVGGMYNDPESPPEKNVGMSRNLIINKCRSSFKYFVLEKTDKMLEIEKQIEGEDFCNMFSFVSVGYIKYRQSLNRIHLVLSHFNYKKSFFRNDT